MRNLRKALVLALICVGGVSVPGCGGKKEDQKPFQEIPAYPGKLSVVVAFTADGKRSASAPSGKPIRLAVDKQVYELGGFDPRGDYAVALRFTPDGQYLVSAHGTYPRTTVRVWDVQKHKLLSKTLASGWISELRQLAVSPDGRLLAIPLKKGATQLLKLPSLGRRSILRRGKHTISGVSFFPDSQRLAVCDTGGTLNLWKVDGSKPYLSKRLSPTPGDSYKRALRRVTVAPSGKILAVFNLGSSGGGRDLLILETQTLKTRTRIDKAEGPMAFSPDSRHLAVGSTAPSLAMIYRVSDGKELQLFRKPQLKNVGYRTIDVSTVIIHVHYLRGPSALLLVDKQGQLRIYDKAK